MKLPEPKDPDILVPNEECDYRFFHAVVRSYHNLECISVCGQMYVSIFSQISPEQIMKLGEIGLSHNYACLILHLDNSALKGRTTVMFLTKIVKAGKKLTHIPVASGCKYVATASEPTAIRTSMSSKGVCLQRDGSER